MLHQCVCVRVRVCVRACLCVTKLNQPALTVTPPRPNPKTAWSAFASIRFYLEVNPPRKMEKWRFWRHPLLSASISSFVSVACAAAWYISSRLSSSSLMLQSLFMTAFNWADTKVFFTAPGSSADRIPSLSFVGSFHRWWDIDGRSFFFAWSILLGQSSLSTRRALCSSHQGFENQICPSRREGCGRLVRFQWFCPSFFLTHRT